MRWIVWYKNDLYISLDKYKENHRTICIDIMQRVKWIYQGLWRQTQGNILHGL